MYDDQHKLLLQRHRSIKEHFKGVKTPIDDVLTWKSGKYFNLLFILLFIRFFDLFIDVKFILIVQYW